MPCPPQFLFIAQVPLPPSFSPLFVSSPFRSLEFLRLRYGLIVYIETISKTLVFSTCPCPPCPLETIDRRGLSFSFWLRLSLLAAPCLFYCAISSTLPLLSVSSSFGLSPPLSSYAGKSVFVAVTNSVCHIQAPAPPPFFFPLFPPSFLHAS